MRKQGTSAPFCASACWWRCPQPPVSRTPSSCCCASYVGNTLFQNNVSSENAVIAPAFSVQRHLFVPLDRSESAPRSPERSAIRASHSLRLYTRHNPFFAALSRLHIPFAAFEQSGASSVFAHQKRLCEILSVNIVFRDTTKVRWDRTAGSAVRLLTTVLPESGR